MHRQHPPSFKSLRGQKAFSSLFTSGQSIRVGPLRGYYRVGESSEGGVAVGFAVTRNIKQATKRNKVKRVLREAWRKVSSGVQALCQTNRTTLQLVILYTGGDYLRKQTVATITVGVAELAKRLMDRIQSKP